MGLAQPVITQQMVISELTKAGINRDIAIDLSYRYYKNELTYKDIEFLKENFDIKLEKVEALLQAEIKSVKTELDNKIDTVENNLNTKIDTKFNELDNKINTVENNLNIKIDTKFNELDNKIDTVRNELKSDIASVSNEISLVRKDMEINKIKFDSTSRLHGWMFGTLITLNIGIFLALMSLLVK
ncbi:Bdr family repetitive protein [Borrelia turicatae]|uniref:Borrelia Direct Repeat protein 6 n=1 Tax=Borrelia turicatae (strain 91E135) TaxID=314724 RepID=A0ABF7R081_BORT9|nr:Bdr family repetitive protein [Borrelia turicatae]ASJ27766.1 Borrelia Direct Repeat protein 6 [Borrelia turicatae 91E135]